MFKKILFAIDDGDTNQNILEQAISFALTTNAQLILARVIPRLTEIYPQPGYIAAHGYHPTIHGETTIKYYRERLEALEQESSNLLKCFANKAQMYGVKAEIVQATGSPGFMICKIAATRGVNLIIIGRHGRTGLSELFLGSVSNYVLHHAPCSVLTIQGKVRQYKTDSLIMETAGI